MLSSTEASKFNTSDLQIDPSSEDTISINGILPWNFIVHLFVKSRNTPNYFNFDIEEASSQLFVWSGSKQNTISILDLKSNAMYATFDRAQHFDMERNFSFPLIKYCSAPKRYLQLGSCQRNSKHKTAGLSSVYTLQVCQHENIWYFAPISN